MQNRVLLRAASSGRSDDNIEAIQNRLKIFHEVSKPIIDEFKSKGMLYKVSSEDSKENVYNKVRLLFKKPGTKYTFYDGKEKVRKQNDDLYENGQACDDNDLESDPTLFTLYESEDGKFRGSLEEVNKYESELEYNKQAQVSTNPNPV